MPSYVLIWENNTFGHQRVKNRTWPGHAAVNIGTRFFVGKGKGENNYVSWWPSESASFDLKGVIKSIFTPAQQGSKHVFFPADVRAEKYLPDHVIKLDTSVEQQAAMRAEWECVWNKEGGSSYKNLRKNCSTIVSRVIHAAGLYAYKWSVDCNFAWSPADVRKLAIGVGGEFMKWDEFLAVLKKSGIGPDNLRRKDGSVITKARSGVYCSTGAPCEYQSDQTFFDR